MSGSGFGEVTLGVALVMLIREIIVRIIDKYSHNGNGMSVYRLSKELDRVHEKVKRIQELVDRTHQLTRQIFEMHDVRDSEGRFVWWAAEGKDKFERLIDFVKDMNMRLSVIEDYIKRS